jgi:hypothetical protein
MDKDMSISDEYMHELSTFIKGTGERLTEGHYPQFCDALGELGLFGSDGLGRVPLELSRAEPKRVAFWLAVVGRTRSQERDIYKSLQ